MQIPAPPTARGPLPVACFFHRERVSIADVIHTAADDCARAMPFSVEYVIILLLWAPPLLRPRASLIPEPLRSASSKPTLPRATRFAMPARSHRELIRVTREMFARDTISLLSVFPQISSRIAERGDLGRNIGADSDQTV